MNRIFNTEITLRNYNLILEEIKKYGLKLHTCLLLSSSEYSDFTSVEDRYGCDMSSVLHFLDTWWWGCRPHTLTVLHPPRKFLLIISVTDWDNSTAIVQIQRFGQLKNITASLGIEPITFWLTAYCLSELWYGIKIIHKTINFPFNFSYKIYIRKYYDHRWNQSWYRDWFTCF
jgi:hypothetical protein